MKFSEYETRAIATAVYPKDIGLLYCALKLSGEAGEIAEKIGKALRSGALYIEHDTCKLSPVSFDLEQELVKELGDVLWYVTALANELAYTLEEIAEINNEKLASRSVRGVIVGSGDNR